MKIVLFILGTIGIVYGVTWLAVHHVRGLYDTAFCLGSPKLQGLVATCSYPIPWGTLLGFTSILGLAFFLWRKG